MAQKDFVQRADFTDMLPAMAIQEAELLPLYIRVYYDTNESLANEYEHNTTTWD